MNTAREIRDIQISANSQTTLYYLSQPYIHFDDILGIEFNFKFFVCITQEKNNEVEFSIFGSDKTGVILSNDKLNDIDGDAGTKFEVFSELGYKHIRKEIVVPIPKKKGSISIIIIGFILAFLGGFGGLIVGSNYAFSSKYNTGTRTAGWIMLFISGIIMIILKGLRNQ